jgi:hypothetical protein
MSDQDAILPVSLQSAPLLWWLSAILASGPHRYHL